MKRNILDEYSTPELVRLLGTRFLEYTMMCNPIQKEMAEQSFISLTSSRNTRSENTID
jgi:hypothetical protein